jgi:hypothetical protein
MREMQSAWNVENSNHQNAGAATTLIAPKMTPHRTGTRIDCIGG